MAPYSFSHTLYVGIYTIGLAVTMQNTCVHLLAGASPVHSHVGTCMRTYFHIHVRQSINQVGMVIRS